MTGETMNEVIEKALAIDKARQELDHAWIEFRTVLTGANGANGASPGSVPLHLRVLSYLENQGKTSWDDLKSAFAVADGRKLNCALSALLRTARIVKVRDGYRAT